jgi:membrane associated rhomboid family serine protease
MGGKLTYLFALNPELIFKKLEWWRIFTYPLANDSIESTMLFLFTFFIFAPKLEDIYQQLLYPFIIILFVNIQGIVLAFLLWNSNIVITGMEGLSFFVLTLFTLINIKQRLILFNRFYMHTGLFTLGIVSIWFIMLFMNGVLFESHTRFFEGIYSAVFGLSVGFTAYLQMRYTKNLRPARIRESYENKEVPNPEDLSLSLIANQELRRFNKGLQDEFSRLDEAHLQFSEDRLNEILDKVHTNGFDSLSNNEKKYLDDYSKQL